MNIRPLLLLRAAMLLAFFVIAAAPSHAHLMKQKDAPFSNIPTEQRDALSKRLGGYVEAYKGRKWEKLYDFVSDMGKGGASQNVFSGSHEGRPRVRLCSDARPDRSDKNESGFDIYGCGKAQREGMSFNGIVVVHAVFEHQDWFFTGWRFTDFPNTPCKELADPKWQSENRVKWNTPMEEITNSKQQGVPVHVDAPH